jgi:hypothetical protein
MTWAQEQNLARPAYDIRDQSAAAGTARLVKADCKTSIQDVATVRALKYDEKPYWNLERARIVDTRQVGSKFFVLAPGRPYRILQLPDTSPQIRNRELERSCGCFPHVALFNFHQFSCAVRADGKQNLAEELSLGGVN